MNEEDQEKYKSSAILWMYPIVDREIYRLPLISQEKLFELEPEEEEYLTGNDDKKQDSLVEPVEAEFKDEKPKTDYMDDEITEPHDDN